jgi:hypothetical protein
MIKAIETYYSGYRFRSRLEARWAVFFDTIGLPYEYEKEGYVLTTDDGKQLTYLPDFWLPTLETWAEVKSLSLNDDDFYAAREKAYYLAVETKRIVIFPLSELKQKNTIFSLYMPDGYFIDFAWFAKCDVANTIGIQLAQNEEYYDIKLPPLLISIFDKEKSCYTAFKSVGDVPRDMKEAYTTARSARFEFTRKEK